MAFILYNYLVQQGYRNEVKLYGNILKYLLTKNYLKHNLCHCWNPISTRHAIKTN